MLNLVANGKHIWIDTKMQTLSTHSISPYLWTQVGLKGQGELCHTKYFFNTIKTEPDWPCFIDKLDTELAPKERN